MKIRKSFEQAICILIILATQNLPVKSIDLSKRLGVSDSYLKKITRQLVVSGLIKSKASKLGGFVINKSTDEITFLDIFNAIEGEERFAETTHLVEKVFDDSSTVQQIEDNILDFSFQAENNYRQKLKEIKLNQIVETGMAHMKTTLP